MSIRAVFPATPEARGKGSAALSAEARFRVAGTRAGGVRLRPAHCHPIQIEADPEVRRDRVERYRKRRGAASRKHRPLLQPLPSSTLVYKL